MSAHAITAVSLADTLGTIDEPWRPKIIAALNGQEVKAAKLRGEFVWHQHDDADEFFLCLRGHLTIDLRDGSVELDPGECVVIPRGVEHRPIARDEVHVLLFEPTGVRNTGDVDDPALTDRRPDQR